MKDLQSQNSQGILLSKIYNYPSGEMRQATASNADPLQLYFKLLINFDKPSGLFADEENINSALAYLKRIGELGRYELLKNWIVTFKQLLADYDFLFLECEGLDEIQNHKPMDQYIEEESKLTFSIRETNDMLVQSLLTTYRHIWFDDERMVEVLPTNLRKFDASVLLFSAGYFSAEFYDDEVNLTNSGNRAIETLIYPTYRKLYHNLHDEFNHQIYKVSSCSINNDESGKPFAATVTNDGSSDFIKNSLCINYRFASYHGRFNNTVGNFDLAAVLAILAAQNQKVNINKSSGFSFSSITDGTALKAMKAQISKENVQKLMGKAKTQIAKESKYQYDSAKSLLATRMNQIPAKIFGSNTVIGQAIAKATDVSFYGQMVKNTFDLGVDYVQEMLVDKPITQLNNKIFHNFSSDLYNAYNSYHVKVKNAAKLDTSMVATENRQQTSSNRVQLTSAENAYTRKSF